MDLETGKLGCRAREAGLQRSRRKTRALPGGRIGAFGRKLEGEGGAGRVGIHWPFL